MPHAGAPLSFCLRVWKRVPAGSGRCVSCPFGAGACQQRPTGLSRVFCTRWYGGLSDYGRCVFGSGPSCLRLVRFSHHVLFAADYSRSPQGAPSADAGGPLARRRRCRRGCASPCNTARQDRHRSRGAGPAPIGAPALDTGSRDFAHLESFPSSPATRLGRGGEAVPPGPASADDAHRHIEPAGPHRLATRPSGPGACQTAANQIEDD
jgi:hypothetical protein